MNTFCTETTNLGLIANTAGIAVNLNDRSDIRLLGYDGLGLVNTRRLSQRGPLQQGDTDLGFRLDPRFIDLAWLIEGVDLPHYYDLRERFEFVWRARDADPVQLIFTFPGGRVRALDVNLSGELDYPSGGRSLTQNTFSGIFKASDYRLYDPDVKTVSFNLLTSSGGLPIPFTVPIPIGASALTTTETILYANGNRLAASEFPIITITGPIDNPVVENLTLDLKIDLTGNGGLSLASGEFVTIDLDGKPRRDSKTIRNQDGDSVDQFLTTDSDLNDWRLSFAGERLPDGTYNDGTNVIRVTGDNVNLLSRVDIQYFDRYEGV